MNSKTVRLKDSFEQVWPLLIRLHVRPPSDQRSDPLGHAGGTLRGHNEVGHPLRFVRDAPENSMW